MKKVAFIHDIFPGGGAERVTLDIAEYLQKKQKDYQCYVFTPIIVEELYTEEVKQLVKVIPVRKSEEEKSKDVENLIIAEDINLIVQVVQPLKHIKDICSRTGCKSIFANHGEPFWQRFAILDSRRKRLINRIFWHLGAQKKYVKKGRARAIAKEITLRHYTDCDIYTVLCEGYKQETCDSFGIRPEDSKIRVIENAERIVKDVTYDKEKIIMFCGRLENTSKRLDRLLRIWGKIQHQLPDYKLLIVGDGEYREDMEQQIVKEKLERIDMVGRQSNVDAYYRKASIVCLTSQTEGWGLCLTEAQAHGCIPVAFGCTAGVRDILSPSGTNGFIVTPFDEEQYAKTLLEIATMDKEQQYQIRKNAVSKRAQYTPEIIMAKWEKLFDELLNHPKS